MPEIEIILKMRTEIDNKALSNLILERPRTRHVNLYSALSYLKFLIYLDVIKAKVELGIVERYVNTFNPASYLAEMIKRGLI